MFLPMSLVVEDASREAINSRKLAAAELRKARKAAKDPRSRLFSDSTDEVPKGILKNGCRIPTKRSASECIDDLSQFMAELNLNISDLSNGRYCPHHCFLNEADEAGDNDEDDKDEVDEDEDDDDNHSNNSDAENDVKRINQQKKKQTKELGNLKKCDCDLNQYGSTDSGGEKPKKSVRFDEKVHEAFFFASRLYDRRNFAKYHLSSRHHPPPKQTKPKKSKHNNLPNKSIKTSDTSDSKSDNRKNESQNVCKQTKSQRAKQSKRDKKKRLNRKDEATETSSDDQGYCSSMHSFSD